MTQFITRDLVNDQVLVKGTDSLGTEGTTVLNGSQWAEIKARVAFEKASEKYEADTKEAVEAIFAPLIKVSEDFEAANVKAESDEDYFEFHPEVEGQTRVSRDRVTLNQHTKILRVLESGDHDRLVWAGPDTLVLAAPAAPAPSIVVEDDKILEV